MNKENAIKLLNIEKECILRQGKTGECCRDEYGCGACDLVQSTDDLLKAYDAAINALEHAEYLERRLKHLLQSDFIRSFDEVNVHTKEYKRDIKEADAKILYLCDGNKCKNGYIECKHTTDITHAKNFEYDGFGGYWEKSSDQSESVRERPKNPILSESVRNCPFEDKTQCSYYKQGLCGKCTFSDAKLAWILKNGLFVCPVCGSETDMQYNLCPCCGTTLC